jgi:hypothetical protein
MSLTKVYMDNVKHNPISKFPTSFGMPRVEKDPTINQLEIDVFQQLQEVDKIHNPVPEPTPENSPEIKTFSFEDIIKELAINKNK